MAIAQYILGAVTEGELAIREKARIKRLHSQ